MSEKVLLVTGASSDIGVSLINKVNKDYEYIIAHHNSDANNLVELKEKLGEKLILIKGNFKDEGATYKFVEDIKEIGKIPTHIVHLPAGKIENLKFPKLTWDKFQDDLNIALRSLVIILNSFLPIMAKNKCGKIIIMLTSYTTNIPPKYLASYVTSKYALLGLLKALANEYSDKGIRINGISPSMIETKFLKDIPELIIKQNAMNSPTGKNLSIDDVVPMFQFLLSEEADSITGQNIAITNGNIM